MVVDDRVHAFGPDSDGLGDHRRVAGPRDDMSVLDDMDAGARGGSDPDVFEFDFLARRGERTAPP
jgi:hypothetical protein